jgi:isopentenyl diphosphate isomerase/L-lactate dehydrogenase-like FMN-dependent dehydrogenase
MSGYTNLPSAADALATIPEIIQAARLRMAPGVWDMVAGGAESEATLRRNREVMETLAFQPRVLRGVTEADISTTVLGQQVASPVQLAPIGTIAHFHPDGATVPAAVAAKRGVLSFVGVLTTPGLADVAKQAQGPLVLQVYVRGDRAWLEGLVGSAENAGYVALCLSVDSTGSANREREVHNRYNRAYAVSPNLPGSGRGVEFQTRFSWRDFEWLRSRTTLPIVVKGIVNPVDAALAVENGADAVYVSNHGGRELDHLPSTMEVLHEICAAVGEQTEVLVDSGFLRGTDVVKALALGARAVLIGKLQLWGLVAGGAEGLEKAHALLDEEIRHTLQLLGVRRLSELSTEYLRSTTPTRRPGSYFLHYDPVGIPRT